MVSNKVYLNQWMVREVEEDGSHHFIGFDIKSRLFVVSPCIISFDKLLKVGITRNEIQYHLIGNPSQDSTVEFTWEVWYKNRGISVGLDITKEYM